MTLLRRMPNGLVLVGFLSWGLAAFGYMNNFCIRCGFSHKGGAMEACEKNAEQITTRAAKKSSKNGSKPPSRESSQENVDVLYLMCVCSGVVVY